MSELKLTAKDFKSDQEVRWCPGCGDYAILAAVQSFMPELGLEREKIVFVSGIGCAARFPYYMKTYGMHSIHGRAPAIATGLAVTRPDLSVWVVSGDGDALSIGGNHLIHALRRNVNIKILMLNNQIYGLTKGQYSPTSEQGKVTGSTPMGSVDYPFNPLSLALGAEATFVARAMDIDKPGLTNVLRRAAAHKGAAFVEIYQNCNIYNDGAFDFVREEKENRLYIEHGRPAGDTGITHDETDFATVFVLSRINYAEHGVVPLGVFRDVPRDSYDELVQAQLDNARGDGTGRRSSARATPGRSSSRRYAASDFEACRSRGIRTTFQASPSFSSPVITQPPGSRAASKRRIPWNADVGNAWWLLCHDSPNEIRLSNHTLRLWSAVSKCRRPQKWQTELIENVTWWSRKIRIAPPQRSAVNAPCQVPAIA